MGALSDKVVCFKFGIQVVTIWLSFSSYRWPAIICSQGSLFCSIMPLGAHFTECWCTRLVANSLYSSTVHCTVLNCQVLSCTKLNCIVIHLNWIYNALQLQWQYLLQGQEQVSFSKHDFWCNTINALLVYYEKYVYLGSYNAILVCQNKGTAFKIFHGLTFCFVIWSVTKF